MKISLGKSMLPGPKNILLALSSATILTLAFPDFDLWFLAWIALVPFLVAIYRQRESGVGSFLLGWAFGTVFFFGTCWWLTFAMIEYGRIWTPLAYFLVLIITASVGTSIGVFSSVMSRLFLRYGSIAVFVAPFVWIAVEYGRYWLLFNNWNAIAYSQAFVPDLIQSARFGGIYAVGFLIVVVNSFFAFVLLPADKRKPMHRLIPVVSVVIVVLTIWFTSGSSAAGDYDPGTRAKLQVVAVQPNVPMSGLNYDLWRKLRDRHVSLAEKPVRSLSPDSKKLIIFPESPMNFMYEVDAEFRSFISAYAKDKGAYVLFNSAEPNRRTEKFFNSALLIDPEGNKVGHYDKMHLVPFGEYAPEPLDGLAPTLVGNFQFGEEYDVFDIGGVRAGILICYESHFPTLSRQFARNGADILIEMTNDGYLGPTGILRQHLASAVFRAVETNRPLLRTTNIGISAYISPDGDVIEPSVPYTEDTRVWSVSPIVSGVTPYVRFGDWVAWMSLLISLIFLGAASRGIRTAN